MHRGIMAHGFKVNGCILRLYPSTAGVGRCHSYHSSSCYHHCITTPKRKISLKQTSHVLFQENRSGLALHPIIRFDWYIARRDKIRMWCAARSYEEVLNIAEPSGWVLWDRTSCMGWIGVFFLWRWMRKGGWKNIKIDRSVGYHYWSSIKICTYIYIYM